MADQRIADDRSRAGDEVEDAGRQPEADAMTSVSTAQQAVVVGAGTQTTTLPAAMAGAISSAPIV